jgi:hypothetical protein
MHVSRRAFLATSMAGAGLALLPGSAPATPGTLATVAQLRPRVTDFLATLSPDAKARATFALRSATWANWNFMGTTLIKPGLPLSAMTGPQRDAALAVMAAVLSPAGFAKASRVMALQDVLVALGDGVGRRSSSHYSLAIFGTPSATDAWGLRFEGHHLTLSVTLVGDDVVSVTPSSFSCNPNDVPVGPARGTTALIEEEDLARTLYADLNSTAAKRALIQERAYRNIMATAGRETLHKTPEGVPVADLTTSQADLVWRLVDVYASEPWTGDLATAQAARVREGDRAATRFAWAGGNEDGTPFYYRITGPTFAIELGAVDSKAQHLHTIYHDFDRTLGRHVVPG